MNLLAASATLFKVPLEERGLVMVQRVEDVHTGEAVHVCHRCALHRWTPLADTPMQSRRRINPSRMRVLIVGRAHPEKLGDLGVAVAVVIGERDGVTLKFGQAINAAAHLLTLEARGHRFFDNIDVPLGDERAGLAASARLSRTNSIDRPPVSHGEDPGVRAAAGRIKAACIAPDLDQHLLGHLFGLRRIAKHPANQPEHLVGDSVIEVFKGALVAARDPLQQHINARGLVGLLIGRPLRSCSCHRFASSRHR